MGNFMSKITQRRAEILLFKNCVWVVFLTAEVKGKFIKPSQ